MACASWLILIAISTRRRECVHDADILMTVSHVSYRCYKASVHSLAVEQNRRIQSHVTTTIPSSG